MLCKDTWTKQIPPEKLRAYKAMIETGRIQRCHVTYIRKTGTTEVEYFTDETHEQIKEAMRKMI